MAKSFLGNLRRLPLSFTEFVGMMAAAMSIYALAIDAMLPALPGIGLDFTVTNPNQLQWVVMLFVLGGGFGQLFYGPLSDWLGRRPVLLFGLFLYLLSSLLVLLSDSLPMLLGLRLVQGLSAAAASVIPRSVVRDRYVGAEMAKVMSITFIVFLIVPVLAPTVGQALLLFMPWRGIFVMFALTALLLSLWIAVRLPETLHREFRRTPSIIHLLQAARTVIGEPSSLYYTLAMTLIMGGLMSYISTVSQIFLVAFRAPALMPTIFAVCAGSMAVAAFTNVRIVVRVGMRPVSHAALLGYIAASLLHALICLSGFETMLSFAILQAMTMAAFGLAASNFNAIAMQKMGEIAGSAASLQGVTSMIGGALLGSLIGHQWAGQEVTFLPLGSLCCGLGALGCILIAEKGRLFRNPPLIGAGQASIGG